MIEQLLLKAVVVHHGASKFSLGSVMLMSCMLKTPTKIVSYFGRVQFTQKNYNKLFWFLLYYHYIEGGDFC
jgi:hypothetical protein